MTGLGAVKCRDVARRGLPTTAAILSQTHHNGCYVNYEPRAAPHDRSAASALPFSSCANARRCAALRRQPYEHERDHSADCSDAHGNKKWGQLRMSGDEAAALIGSESDFRMSNAHTRDPLGC